MNFEINNLQRMRPKKYKLDDQMSVVKRRFLFVFMAVISTAPCFAQNTFPATGTTVLNSGSDDNLVLKDSRAGTNWNYIEWQFADGSRDWVLGRRVNTGSFALWRTGLNDVVTVDNAGNFGIGTTSPQAKLDVNGAIAVNGVEVINNGGQDVYANLRVLRNTSTTFPDGMYIGYGGSGGPLRFFSNNGTTEMMTLTTSGRLGIGTTSPEAKFTISQIGNEWNDGLRINRDASNYLTITEDVTDARIKNWGAGGILFFTSTTQAATILNNGNLGIGTSSPLAKLDVHQNGGESGQNSGIRVRAGNSQNYFGNTQLSFSYAGGTGYSHAIKTRHSASSAAGNAFDFYVWKPGDAVEAEGTNLVMTLNGSNVGIGTASPNEKLTVNGTIYGKEIKVDLSVPGPDYVFEKDYNLPSLDELKAYIELNKHLPEVPSAKEMEEHGINLGEMNMILLKKVEELTLYVLELKRENGEIKKQLKIKE